MQTHNVAVTLEANPIPSGQLRLVARFVDPEEPQVFMDTPMPPNGFIEPGEILDTGTTMYFVITMVNPVVAGYTYTIFVETL